MFTKFLPAFILLAAGLALLSGCGQGTAEPAPKKPVAENQATRAGRPRFGVPLSSIPILKTVLKPSPYYTIDDQVLVDGYFYVFMVHSSLGDQKVATVRELIKYCHEIDIIEHYQRTHKGSNFMDGMKQSVKGVGKGFSNLVVHPGQSLKRVGQGTGRLFRALGAPFRRRKAPIYASDGTNRALLGSGPGGGERRLLASELGLDVYTDNPLAQKFIKTVAHERMMGKLPIGSAVFALPGGIVFTLSLTPMGFDPTTEELIRNNAPAELKRLLGLRYKEYFGLDYQAGGTITRMLDNPNFTPREQAYILRYLLDMKNVGGRDHALRFLAGVDSPQYAKLVVAQLEMLALVHRRGKRFARFVPVRNTLGALGGDNSLCLLISIDTVRYWDDVRVSIEAALAAARKQHASRVEIWSTGDIDQRSMAMARHHGIIVYQNILQNKIFSKPRQGSRPLTPADSSQKTLSRPEPPAPVTRREPRKRNAEVQTPTPTPVKIRKPDLSPELTPEITPDQTGRHTQPAPAKPGKKRVEEVLPQLY